MGGWGEDRFAPVTSPMDLLRQGVDLVAIRAEAMAVAIEAWEQDRSTANELRMIQAVRLYRSETR